MGLKIEQDGSLEEIAKYMTEAVKQTPSKRHPRFWDLKDLITYFENDNGFDYKLRMPIWESMNGYEMQKTYKNIFEMLNLIVKANEEHV